MPDMHELIHCAPVRLPSGQHETMYYVRPSDAEKMLREIKQLQQALDHEHEQRIAAAVEGSRWKAEALRLRTVARSVCDYLAAEPDCCPSLSLEARIEQLAMALATEDHGDA